jgi:hypothetical protein
VIAHPLNLTWQAVFTWVSWAVALAMIAVAAWLGRRQRTPLTGRGLLAIWGAEIAMSCVFEMIGTGVNVYTYYGPYEFRLWHYPAVIGVLEGTQTLLFTVLAAQVWRRVRGWRGLVSLFALFPMTMFGANFGLGSPVIIALHLDGSAFSAALVWVATFLSMGLCCVAVRGAWLFLPGTLRADPAGVPAGRISPSYP